jgi:hypothetical protein
VGFSLVERRMEFDARAQQDLGARGCDLALQAGIGPIEAPREAPRLQA